MSGRLHLRKSDKSEDIKNIVYPKELEELGKLYDEERKEICLLVKEDCDSFYQIGTMVLSSILNKDEAERVFCPHSEDVRDYPNGSKLSAAVYNTKDIEKILESCNYSTLLNDFLNSKVETQKERIDCVKYLIELYKFIVNNQLELVIH